MHTLCVYIYVYICICIICVCIFIIYILYHFKSVYNGSYHLKMDCIILLFFFKKNKSQIIESFTYVFLSSYNGLNYLIVLKI